jgi:hypothetical protein
MNLKLRVATRTTLDRFPVKTCLLVVRVDGEVAAAAIAGEAGLAAGVVDLGAAVGELSKISFTGFRTGYVQFALACFWRMLHEENSFKCIASLCHTRNIAAQVLPVVLGARSAYDHMHLTPKHISSGTITF